jgi:hypothetical protein
MSDFNKLDDLVKRSKPELKPAGTAPEVATSWIKPIGATLGLAFSVYLIAFIPFNEPLYAEAIYATEVMSWDFDEDSADYVALEIFD